MQTSKRTWESLHTVIPAMLFSRFLSATTSSVLELPAALPCPRVPHGCGTGNQGFPEELFTVPGPSSSWLMHWQGYSLWELLTCPHRHFQSVFGFPWLLIMPTWQEKTLFVQLLSAPHGDGLVMLGILRKVSVSLADVPSLPVPGHSMGTWCQASKLGPLPSSPAPLWWEHCRHRAPPGFLQTMGQTHCSPPNSPQLKQDIKQIRKWWLQAAASPLRGTEYSL